MVLTLVFGPEIGLQSHGIFARMDSAVATHAKGLVLPL